MISASYILCPFCGKPFGIHKGLPIPMEPMIPDLFFRKQVFFCAECHAIIEYNTKTDKVTVTKLDPNDKNYHKKIMRTRFT